MEFLEKSFDDFQFKPHFDNQGNLKGFTLKDIVGKKYFDENGNYKGQSIKNFNNKSDYFDSNNKYLGSSIDEINNKGFLKADGSISSTPKMFELKDPNFHKNIHEHFQNYRSGLLKKII
ncbi:MAG: hypothetical protein N2043_11085 [Ignavibacterium sp.]|nr:hypothetical protein [Ignavibacterium sp.]